MSIRFSTFARDAVLLVALALGIYVVVRPVAETRTVPVDTTPVRIDQFRFDQMLAESTLAVDLKALKLRPEADVEVGKALGADSPIRKDLEDVQTRLKKVEWKNAPDGALQFGNLLICWGTYSNGEHAENIKIVKAASVPVAPKPKEEAVCLEITYPGQFGIVPQLTLDNTNFTVVAPSTDGVFIVGTPIVTKQIGKPPILNPTRVRYMAIGIAAAPAP